MRGGGAEVTGRVRVNICHALDKINYKLHLENIAWAKIVKSDEMLRIEDLSQKIPTG